MTYVQQNSLCYILCSVSTIVSDQSTADPSSAVESLTHCGVCIVSLPVPFRHGHSEVTLTCFFASFSVITDFKGHIVSNVSAKSEDLMTALLCRHHADIVWKENHILPRNHMKQTCFCLPAGSGGRVCKEAAGTGSVLQDERRVRVP